MRAALILQDPERAKIALELVESGLHKKIVAGIPLGRLDLHEAYALAEDAVFDAARDFRPERGPFSYLARLRIKSFIVDAQRKLSPEYTVSPEWFGLHLVQRSTPAASWTRFKARRLAFTVKAIAGSPSGAYVSPADAPSPLEPTVVHAQLEVEAKRFLHDCSATVTQVLALDVVKGKVRGEEKTVRTWINLAGYPREIGWPSGEGVTRTRNLVPRVPRSCFVATLDQSEPGKFHIAAIDRLSDLEHAPGWYKVTVVLASESADEAVQSVDLAIGLGRREYPPPPLQCLLWRDEYEDSLGSDD